MPAEMLNIPDVSSPFGSGREKDQPFAFQANDAVLSVFLDDIEKGIRQIEFGGHLNRPPSYEIKNNS